MAQENRINVTIHQAQRDTEWTEPLEFEDIHYISFVTSETYAIPAILSEDRYKDEGLPLRVLYVNPANIAAMEAERIA